MSDHDGHNDHDGHDHGDADAPAVRVEALESLLVDKGLVDTARVDELIQRFADDLGPLNGARVVARAWTDGDYRQRLLEDGTTAVAELDVGEAEAQMVVVVENTPNVHNLVVCTLCSCYPWALLGLPPAWYKSFEYRARAVREPRRVLAEFGTEVADDVEVRVWDSSAEVRYLVLPERPDGTDGLDESALAELVDRDAMIGVRRVRVSA